MTKNDRAVDKFGRALREIRLEHDWTQLQLAEELGLDVAYISRIERGEKDISLSTVERIANALGMTIRFGKYRLTKS